MSHATTAAPLPSAAKRRRQRSPSPPAPRKKSCEACRRAKARCNEATPSCSRCQRKGVQCNYDGTRNEDSTPPSAAAHNDIDLAMLIDHGLNGLGGISDQYIEALAGTDAFMTASTALPKYGIPDVLGVPRYVPTLESPEDTGASSSDSSGGSPPGYQSSMTSIESPESGKLQIDPVLVEAHQQTAANANWDSNMLPFTMVSHYREDGSKEIEIVPNESSDEFNPRFFGFNVCWPPDAPTSGNRLIDAFKIWPRLMVKADQLPPFIHPHFPALSLSENSSIARQYLNRPRKGFPPKLPEPLANCSSICTMFFNKTPENLAFVWKNIKREQERIYENYRDWSAQDVISSFQAMLIYSFLRMIDGEHDHNNFDMAFVLTVSEVGTSLWSDKLRALQTRKAESTQVNWTDWMLAESSCRTSMVFQFMFIMLQLYRALPPVAGCRGIDDVPLPCGRKLWQAQSYNEWLAEYKKYQASRKSTRVLKFGDLRVMRDDSSVSLTPEEREDLATWAADLDDFGTVVLMAGLSGPGSLLDDYRRNHLGDVLPVEIA